MKVLDLSFSRLPAGWAEARKAEGYEALIQALWTGGYANNDGLQAVASHNLRLAREAGLITAGYLNTNPWYPATTSLVESQRNAGAEWDHLDVVFNDVEIAGVTQQQILDHCRVIEAAGKRTAIYSARWFWSSIGNPQWRWLRGYPLWVADYDGDPSLDTTLLFGPWVLADVVGKQYKGTTNLGGVQVDLNTFRPEFLKEDDDVALTPRQEQALEQLAKLTVDPFEITLPNGQRKTFASFTEFLKAHHESFDVHRFDWLLGRK